MSPPYLDCSYHTRGWGPDGRDGHAAILMITCITTPSLPEQPRARSAALARRNNKKGLERCGER